MSDSQPMVFLAAHDFSPSADDAAAVAAREAHMYSAELLLLHVASVPPAPTGWLPSQTAFPEWQRSRELAHERAKRRLEEIAEELSRDNPGLSVRTKVAEGFPAEVILAIAKKEHVDRITVGDLGKTPLSKTLSKMRIGKLILGSVAERVVRLAEVPVLVVKRRNAEGEG